MRRRVQGLCRRTEWRRTGPSLEDQWDRWLSPEAGRPNAEIVDLIDSSDEWIRERSGIIERRFAGPDEGIIEMTEWAAQPALEMAGIEGKDLDAVIMATVTWPYQTPAAAPLLAERLGSKGAAFDISAACAGYCHGIALASDMVGEPGRQRPGPGRRAALRLHRPQDRGTAFIFGDGAGAAVVSASDSPASARPSGDPTVPSGTRSRSARAGSTCTPRTSAGRRSAWPGRRSSGGRSGDGPGGAARARRRGHHGRSTRCLHPPPGQRPDHRRDDQSSSCCRRTSRSLGTSPTPATPPPPRFRWRWSGWCATGRSHAAASPSRSASAPASRMPRRSSSSPDPRVPRGRRVTKGQPQQSNSHEGVRHMAASEQEILEGLAEIVNEETGRTRATSSWTSPSPRTSTSTPLDDDDCRQRRGEVRRPHPRRRGQEPQDRR